MKNILIYTAVAVSILICNGCSYLDMEPVSSVTNANYWKSADHFKAFNTGLHSLLRKHSFNLFLLGEARSDIFGDSPFSGEATQGMERFPYNTLNAEYTGVENFADFYETINQLNLMIEQVTKTTVLETGTQMYYLGEAYGLRAFLYFQLLRTWGASVIVTEPTDGSTIDLSNLKKAASTEFEVMALIKKDIDNSLEAFGTVYGFELGREYWSKAATLMLKGEVYLWSGNQMDGGEDDYREAKNALIEIQENVDVALESQFADIFAYDNKGNSEIIFTIRNAQNEYTLWDNKYAANLLPQRINLNSYYDESGVSYIDLPEINMYGTIRLQAKKGHYFQSFRQNDTRKSATLKAVYQKEVDGTFTYINVFPYKFQGVNLEGSNQRSMLDDYPIYRYADCLLLLAEAKALLGEDPTGLINEVRERAYGSTYFNEHYNEVAYPNDKGSFYDDNPFMGSDEDVFEAILKERLREFMFEGKRWYDLRRFGNNYVFKYTLADSSDPRKLLWPINETALTNNSLLEQTPGY